MQRSTQQQMKEYVSSVLFHEHTLTGNLTSTQFGIVVDDKSTTSLQPLVLSHRFKISYKLFINDKFLDSQDTRSEALISSLEQSGVWRLLHLKFQLRYSDINTFEVHLEDAIFTESVISKFNTNLLERDAIDTLDSVNVDIKYHTASYNHQHFKRELNYLHYSMLLCHWEHQMPFIFNIKTRELLLNNLDNMGNLSFSLTNSSQLMIKLMRTIESQAESLTSQLEELSKNSKNRGRCKSTYPIQFFG